MRSKACRIAVLGASLTIIQGCAGFQPAQVVLDDLGPAQVYSRSWWQLFTSSRSMDSDDVQRLNRTSRETYPNLFGVFVEDYRSAISDLSSGTSSATALKMARSGYDLADYYCAQFFQSGGESQGWLNLSKDLVAALGTLATGASAITGTSGSRTAILALSTTASYNAIDVYSRNFLFGASNINSVRALTMRAMTAHRASTLDNENAAKAVWTFGSALRKIEEHQSICQSSAIRDLVLGAINTTKVAIEPQPITTGSGPNSNNPAAATTFRLN